MVPWVRADLQWDAHQPPQVLVVLLRKAPQHGIIAQQCQIPPPSSPWEEEAFSAIRLPLFQEKNHEETCGQVHLHKFEGHEGEEEVHEVRGLGNSCYKFLFHCESIGFALAMEIWFGYRKLQHCSRVKCLKKCTATAGRPPIIHTPANHIIKKQDSTMKPFIQHNTKGPTESLYQRVAFKSFIIKDYVR